MSRGCPTLVTYYSQTFLQTEPDRGHASARAWPVTHAPDYSPAVGLSHL